MEPVSLECCVMVVDVARHVLVGRAGSVGPRQASARVENGQARSRVFCCKLSPPSQCRRIRCRRSRDRLLSGPAHLMVGELAVAKGVPGVSTRLC